MKSIYIADLKSLIRSSSIATITFFLLLPFYVRLYDRCGVDIAIFFTVFMMTVHIITYWTLNLFYFICDTYGYLQKYKLPRKPYQIPKQTLVVETIKQSIFGQLFIEPLSCYFLLFPLWQLNNPTIIYDADDIANNKLYYVCLIYSKFAVCRELNMWLFYFAHVLLHHPLFYVRIHKQHHKYEGTISFAAEYAHQLETILANLTPTFIGLIITAAHPLQCAIWLFWKLQETYEIHSGYSFQGTFLHKIGLTNADGAVHHDLHHSRKVGNYSAKICDVLGGTLIK